MTSARIGRRAFAFGMAAVAFGAASLAQAQAPVPTHR